MSRNSIHERAAEQICHCVRTRRQRLEVEAAQQAVGYEPLPTVQEILTDFEVLVQDFTRLGYDEDNHTLSAVTGAIQLEGVPLGPFSIDLHVDDLGVTDQPAQLYSVTALEPHPPVGRQDVTHPHVRGGHLCAGDAMLPIRNALENGRVGDFFLLVRAVLETYNADSAFVRCEQWSGALCYDCGIVIGPDAQHQCDGCGRLFCPDCISHCGRCESTLCFVCARNCPFCSLRELHDAVAAGDLEKAENLISEGADVNAEDEFGRTPLDYAESKSMEKLLVGAGAWTELNPLQRAAKCGSVRRVERLIARGHNVNGRRDEQWTALHWACAYGHTAVVEILLKHGADIAVEAEDYTPLCLAIEGGHDDVLRLLVRHKNSKGRTLLHEAASERGGEDYARILLEYGADINAKDNTGRTALHWAVGRDDLRLTATLVSNGADPNMMDDDGLTPLHYACSNLHTTSLARTLLYAGADVNALDHDGWAPLDWVVGRPDQPLTRLLHERGGHRFCRY